MKSQIITRIWHGKTDIQDGEAYFDVLNKTGVKDYAQTVGIKSIKILREDKDNESHFWVVTEWENLESVKAFAGENYNEAKYYKEDEAILLEKEKEVLNLETFPVFGEMKYLQQQLDGLFTGENWVAVSVRDSLNDISYESAVTKKLPNRHSIYEIVEHSLTWRNFLLTRLKGGPNFEVRQNDENDWKRNRTPTAQDWEDLKTAFFNSQKELLNYLDTFDDRLLEETVPGRNYKYRFMINGIVQHDFYHFGQVSLLR